MRVSFTLFVALTGLLATATAIDADPPPSFGWGSIDREASDSTDREASSSTDREASGSTDRKASGSTDREASGSTDREAAASKSSKSFAKLGFCNSRTLKGRYNGFSNGNADISGVFVGPPIVDPLFVGPESQSITTYYGTNRGGQGRSFTQTVARPSKGPGALGPLIVFNTWSQLIVDKNCSVLEQGGVIEYTSPGHLILPASTSFLEGNVAPDGSDLVFTKFVTDRIKAFSGDSKRVSKTALPPQQFIDGPPQVPGSCNVAQSCSSKHEGKDCKDNSDCIFFCFPSCRMFCASVLGPGSDKCLSV